MPVPRAKGSPQRNDGLGDNKGVTLTRAGDRYPAATHTGQAPPTPSPEHGGADETQEGQRRRNDQTI